MATLYEYYRDTDYGVEYIFINDWWAQIFTPSVAHKITSVKLWLFREGTPGTVTVSIQGVNGDGHPDGIDLCSGTTEGDDLTEDEGGEWREITLGAGYNLTAGVKYAIVVRAPDAAGLGFLEWLENFTSPTYTGGWEEYSEDSGDTWATYVGGVFMFEEWGSSIFRRGWWSK